MMRVVSLRDAVKEFVRDGDIVYAAGFTHLIPFAAAHEIIRQRRRELVLCRATPDLLYDQMIAAGCARKAVFSWAGNPGVGSLRALRRAIEQGRLEVEEYTHFGLISRLYAGAANLPFLPLRSGPGSDLPTVNPQMRTVRCPYTSEVLATVPALKPDVALIHAQRADADGNVQLWGIVGEQREAAMAASRVIVTVEEIVDTEVIRSDPNRTAVPGLVVDAVAVVPWGAHPSYAQGYYDRDNRSYLEWEVITKAEDGYERWLEEWVFGMKDRDAYIAHLGWDRVAALQTPPRLSKPVNYGTFAVDFTNAS